MALGLLLGRVARRADMTAMDSEAPSFVPDVREALGRAFSALREEADKSGDREVFSYLSSPGACRRILQLLVTKPVATSVASPAVPEALGESGRSSRGAGEGADLRLLTWNICEAEGVQTKSVQAPDTWTKEENREAVQQEILRWDADVVGLQECPSVQALPQLSGRYVLVGSSAKTHAGCVQLNVRRELQASVVELAAEVPGVGAALSVNGESVLVVALHLAHGGMAAATRGKQLRAVFCGREKETIIVMGDMNMRDKDAAERTKHHGLVEAAYEGFSWNPMQSRYFAWDPDRQPEAACRYDRVWFRGGVFAYAYLVGRSRFFHDGQDFVLSDHSGVMALASVRGVHRGTAGSAVVRDLRAVLACARDREASAEVHVCNERLREGWARAALMKARREDRERGATLAEARRVAKVVRERKQALRARAFGPGSLFRGSE